MDTNLDPYKSCTGVHIQVLVAKGWWCITSFQYGQWWIQSLDPQPCSQPANLTRPLPSLKHRQQLHPTLELRWVEQGTWDTKFNEMLTFEIEQSLHNPEWCLLKFCVLGTSLNPALWSIVTLQVPGRNHLEPSAKHLSFILARKALCHASPCEKDHHYLWFPANKPLGREYLSHSSFWATKSWYNTSVVSPLLSRATILNQSFITVQLGYCTQLLNSSMPSGPPPPGHPLHKLFSEHSPWNSSINIT